MKVELYLVDDDGNNWAVTLASPGRILSPAHLVLAARNAMGDLMESPRLSPDTPVKR